jgi:hypothetical protein
MTILVDDLRRYPRAMFEGRPEGSADKLWCRVTSDEGEEELHAFARRVRIKRRWFQGDHYDVTEGRRNIAVRLGAEEVSRKELVRRCYARRAEGK